MTWFPESEPTVRLGVFLAVFLAMALWEVVAPFRTLRVSKPRRWLRNIGLVVVNTLLVRVTLPAGAIGMAWLAAERGWGVLNVVSVEPWLAVIATVVFLDFAIYLQHVMFHAVPAFWRLHQVHHADLDFDVTLGARFHPVEIVLSMVIKIGLVALIGAPPLAVLIFEVVLNATAMFNHSNVRLPAALEPLVRWFLVTPDMHRVHHSISRAECNSNFGFNLSWWDRALGTYIAEPALGQERMMIGVSHLREPRQTIWWMMLLPFRAVVGGYPFGRRQAPPGPEGAGP